MEHRHLAQCDSTQNYLKNLMDEEPERSPMAISTESQSHGIGRQGNEWIHFEESLALSLCLLPAKKVSLTPLELGLLVINFVKERFQQDLFLKWPNDIMNSQKQKVGGIIIQSSKSDYYIAGVGLNFSQSFKEHKFEHFNAGFIQIKNKFNKESLSRELVDYIVQNRISDENQIKNQWEKHCIHLNKDVKIIENGVTLGAGKFSGIGSDGQAILSIENEVNHFYSGSLVF